jgi:hypothetical protein
MTTTMPEAVPGTAMTKTETEAETRGWWSRRPWLRIFLGGLGLWSATVLVTFATHNANLVPTIILLGSFLVPVAFVTYAFGHADAVVTAQRIFTAFVYGGVLGVLGASVLEAAFLRQPSGPAYAGVGLIEEASSWPRCGCSPGACPATPCGTGSCSAPPSGSASPPSRAPATPSTPCSPPAARR